MGSKVRLSAAVVLMACAAVHLAALGTPEYYPVERWRTAIPESQGLSSAELVKVLDFIAEQQLEIHSLLLVRHGWLVLEAYFYPAAKDTLHDICSCTKSISSTLIGIALEQGKIRSLQETLPELFPSRRWDNDTPTKRRMTLENILTMTTGMNYPILGEPRLAGMRTAPDYVQAVLDLPMVAEPGTVFGYNSGGSHLLSAIITQRTGDTAEVFARKNLFQPLGICRWKWPVDPQGNSFGWGDLKLKSTDMARFGYLFLKKGRWEGKQIVSTRWVREATRRRSDPGGSAGYGYQWWLQKDPPRFEALGRAGQRITVIPELDVVMVCTGGGFEPKDVGDRLGAAVRSDRAIPEDTQGYALLQEKIMAAGAPPAARPVAPLPRVALEISGKKFFLADNMLDLRAITFTFPGGDTALLGLVTDREVIRPMGLDGVYRITREDPNAEPIAIRGSWIEEKSFELTFNEFTASKTTRAKATFSGSEITLEVKDPYDNLDIIARGRAEE